MLHMQLGFLQLAELRHVGADLFVGRLARVEADIDNAGRLERMGLYGAVMAQLG